MSKLSKKLARAIAEGKVEVANNTAGEVGVWFPNKEGEEKRVFVPAYSKAELAPKHTSPELLRRSRNLNTLLYQGRLHIL